MPQRTITVNTSYYTFHQNNPGGRTFRDESVGDFVVIEATSPQEANSIAESIGIYFSGVENGRDCRCCGDRWYLDGEESEKFDIANYQNEEYVIYDEFTVHLYEYKSTHTLYEFEIQTPKKTARKRGYKLVTQKVIK